MTKYRFLCIDDSKSVHAFLRQCLEPLALEITDCFNGLEGLETYKKSPESFDVIFLDWEMPVMDGPTTFENLRKSGVKIPVIMLTSKNDPHEIMQMIEAGVAEYILKPFTQELIQEKLRTVMGA